MWNVIMFRFGDVIASWKAVTGILTFQRDNGPIDDIASIEKFIATRAAFVAQKTLYGYLKTRIGTRYPRVFEDETYLRSINIAKYHVFAACLADLAIYAVATALRAENVPDRTRCELALRCFRRALEENSDDVPIEFDADESLAGFAARLDMTDWRSDALHRSNFSESPKALLRWAPIADHLKEEDAEIVQNSVKFAWRDVREQFHRRLAEREVVADCERQLALSRGDEGHA
jgi:hypothetical protein